MEFLLGGLFGMVLVLTIQVIFEKRGDTKC
jgi:hypothetical protein